jgi:hypothetical protein
VATEVHLHDPQTLYRHWAGEQWSPFDVDLSTDGKQWPVLDPDVREIIYFALSSLMVAEERIATKFTGLVAAHGSDGSGDLLGVTQDDIREFALSGLSRRLKIIGVPLESL